MAEIKMPQLGETVVEGTITKWLKKEGDQIEADDLLVEVSTDKVDSEIPSSESGVLQKILVQEGETVKVGTALAIVGDGAAASGDAGGDEGSTDESQAQTAESAAADDQPAAQGEGSEPEAAQAPPAEEPAPQPDKDEGEKEKEKQPEKASETEGAAARGAPGDQSKRGII